MRTHLAAAALALVPLLSAAPAHADPAWHAVTPNWTWPQNGLYSVSAAADDDVWIGGYQGELCWWYWQYVEIGSGWRKNCATPAKPVLQHWNGAKWTSFSPPGMELTPGVIDEVRAFSPTSAWAFSPGYAIRWTGTSWSRVRPPVAQERVIDVEPDATGLWALEYDGTIHRFDGTAWHAVHQVPGRLTKISTASPSDAWAVGYTLGADDTRAPAAVHWDGTTWTSRALPASTGEPISVAAIGGGEALAVVKPADGFPYPILHWDGSAWQRLGDGYDAPIKAVRTADGTLLMSQGDNAATRWDGSAWVAYRAGYGFGTIRDWSVVPGTDHLWTAGDRDYPLTPGNQIVLGVNS